VGGVSAGGTRAATPAGDGAPSRRLAPPAAAGTEASTSFPGAWLAALLALLTALAVGLVARNRSGPVPATAWIDRPAAGPGPFAEGAGAPVLAGDDPIVLVRRAFDALTAADVDTAAGLMHPDVTWPGDPRTGTLHGRDEFRAHWAERLSHVRVHLEPTEFDFVDDELIVATHEVVRRRSTDAWYGEYKAERRFTFRDGLIASMTRGPRRAG
jgi:ketosteroid isomerase-like protein